MKNVNKNYKKRKKSALSHILKYAIPIGTICLKIIEAFKKKGE